MSQCRYPFSLSFLCVHPCVCVHMLITPCVCAGVRAYPSVCVCTLLGSAQESTDAEKTVSVAEETDIDAEEAVQVPAAEDLNLNRGVTDLDATAKTPDLNLTENKVNHSWRNKQNALWSFYINNTKKRSF